MGHRLVFHMLGHRLVFHMLVLHMWSTGQVTVDSLDGSSQRNQQGMFVLVFCFDPLNVANCRMCVYTCIYIHFSATI